MSVWCVISERARVYRPMPGHTLSRLISLLPSRSIFCSGLGGPALRAPSSLTLATLSSVGRDVTAALSLSVMELMLAFALWP